LSEDTTEMLFLAAFAFGKSIRERAGQSGKSCEPLTQLNMLKELQKLNWLKHQLFSF